MFLFVFQEKLEVFEDQLEALYKEGQAKNPQRLQQGCVCIVRENDCYRVLLEEVENDQVITLRI
jgi:hypothetical protein